MNVVKKAMTACALAGAGLVLAVVPAGPALASTTVGQVGPPLAVGILGGGQEAVQTDAAMSAGGTVTSLNTLSAAVCNSAAGVYDLQVLRPLGGGQYKVLGGTGNLTDPCDGNYHSYPVNIPVQAGDVIGVYIVSNWLGLVSGSSGAAVAGLISQPAVGDTITLPTQTATGTLDESATLAGASVPVVTGVSPASGPLAGGTTVTITGTGLTGATAVSFGGTAATSFTVNGDGSITATAPDASSVGPVDVTVTTPAGTSAASPADQYSYLYSFTGFAAPVANPPAVNMVHAGQSIPIQFQLGGDYGLGILAAGSPTAQQVNCTSGAPSNTATATDTAGASGLQYDATSGTYTYVWKTSKAAEGTCQMFTLQLNDGTSYTAIFQYIN